MFREFMLRSTLLVAGLLAGAVSPCTGQVYPPGVQVPTSVFTGPERITVGGHLVFDADFNLTSEIHFQDGRAVAFQRGVGGHDHLTDPPMTDPGHQAVDGLCRRRVTVQH